MSTIKNADFRTKATLLIILLTLAMFFVFRLLIFISYHNVFAALSTAEVLKAFLQGLRFDFAMTATFVLPLLLLLNLPFNNKISTKTLLYILLFVLLTMFGFLAGDFVYFDYVKKHMAEELLVIGHDIGFIVEFALKKLWPLLLLSFAAVGGLILLINKIVNKHFIRKKSSWPKEAARLLLIVILILLGIRGKIFSLGKPIGIADVYSYASGPAAANLTLNGVFTSFHTLRKGTMDIKNPMPFDKAITIARRALEEPGVEFTDDNFPLIRRIDNNKPANKYNVFVVLLEGWNPYYVDGLTGAQDKKFGVTPFFDSITKDSVVFENAYSSGLRSIFGFGSSFAGVPLVPGLPMFGYGLEMSALSSIGKTFSDMGYYTIFSQASNRDSYRLCSLASGALGMQNSYGREDIPELLPYKEKAAFGYDYDMLMFTADKVKDKKNFLALTFTAISHDPFSVTLEEFEKYPRTSWENMFLNSLAYSDYSLKSLVEKAKKEGWFDNTIFVILADHSSGDYHRSSLKEIYKIPFIIYAPKILKAQRVKHTVSQNDLLPTIYALLDLKVPYTALGKDALSGAGGRFAFFSDGINIGLITDGGAVMHNGERAVQKEGVITEKDEETLLSLDKVTTELIKKNKWFK